MVPIGRKWFRCAIRDMTRPLNWNKVAQILSITGWICPDKAEMEELVVLQTATGTHSITSLSLAEFLRSVQEYQFSYETK